MVFQKYLWVFSQKTGVTTTPPPGDATCVILYDQFRIMNKHKICTFMHGIIAEYRVDLYLCQHSIVMSLVMSWSTSSPSHRLVIVKSSTQSLGIDYTFILYLWHYVQSVYLFVIFYHLYMVLLLLHWIECRFI